MTSPKSNTPKNFGKLSSPSSNQFRTNPSSPSLASIKEHPSILHDADNIQELNSAKFDHVQYILLAEFDIDKGASLTHQYPEPTGMEESLLAEMMLPDGAHLREEDWTIFLLNQKPQFAPSLLKNNKDQPPVEAPDLLYVLNLVVTKHDREARRGAHVKAMAICTRHRYIHIYKPILVLALENYFQSPSINVLSSLFQAVNSMDTSLLPNFSVHEKTIMRCSEDKDMFEEKFSQLELIQLMDQQAKFSPDSPTELTHQKRSTYIDLSSGQRKEVLTNKNKDRHFFETAVIYESIKIPIRVPLTSYPEEVGDFSLIKLITTFSSSPLPTNRPLHSHLDTSGPHTHPIILLLNALLTEKRIIFLGSGLPSGLVANYVLAACAMGSGSGMVLRGFLERAFPYTNLTNLETLLQYRGFIAGVTNPAFEEHPKWWDVLCNISTGKITVSPHVGSFETLGSNSSEQAQSSPEIAHLRMPSTISTTSIPNSTTTSLINSSAKSGASEKNVENPDSEFILDILSAIQSHYGEYTIRAKFIDYISRFVNLAALYEEETTGTTAIGITPDNTPDTTGLLGHGVIFSDDMAKQKEITMNLSRIEGWKQTLSYHYYEHDFIDYLDNRSISKMHVSYQIAKLRSGKLINELETDIMCQSFLENVINDDQIIEFLAHVPQNLGGLTPLTVCLFHPNKNIRSYIVQFLNRLNQHQTGARFIQNLNLFHKLAYERQCLSTELNGPDNFKGLKAYLNNSTGSKQTVQ